MKGFLDLYMKVLKENYVNFKGRAGRAEFWVFVIISSIIGWLLGFVGGLINPYVGYILYGLFGLAILLPYLGVAARRMHDLGKGAGWIFISCVPIIGGIWFLILCIKAGEPNENRFGAVPALCDPTKGDCCNGN